jgi:ABC-type metal ion transport system substrate-binding protein
MKYAHPYGSHPYLSYVNYCVCNSYKNKQKNINSIVKAYNFQRQAVSKHIHHECLTGFFSVRICIAV